MCGRFTLRTPMGVLVEHFAIKTEEQLVFRFNVAPTQSVAAIRASGENKERQLSMLHWGLVPSWADDPSIGNRLINARAETLVEKSSFRTPFKKRRCLIAADGYYEWQKVGRTKQPYLIHLTENRPFAFAGLWEQWRSRSSGDLLESCTVITTESNPATKPLHDRMPAIVQPKDYDLWLDPEVDDLSRLQPLLQPYGGDDLVAEAVSMHVNNPKNDDPRCIEPASTAGDFKLTAS